VEAGDSSKILVIDKDPFMHSFLEKEKERRPCTLPKRPSNTARIIGRSTKEIREGKSNGGMNSVPPRKIIQAGVVTPSAVNVPYWSVTPVGSPGERTPSSLRSRNTVQPCTGTREIGFGQLLFFSNKGCPLRHGP
jgi:hypothetical protein